VNKKQLAQLFARISRRSPARAADDIDHLVYRMLKELKRRFTRTLRHRSTAAGSDGSKQERE
jgi:hypothetical protein